MALAPGVPTVLLAPVPVVLGLRDTLGRAPVHRPIQRRPCADPPRPSAATGHPYGLGYSVSLAVMNSSRAGVPSSVCRTALRMAGRISEGSATRSL